MLELHQHIAFMPVNGFFFSWCTEQSLNPVIGVISSVLEFLQHLLDTGGSTATLKGVCGNPEEASQAALCPVRALRQYMLKTASWRTTDKLLVCFGVCRKDAPLSKRLAH